MRRIIAAGLSALAIAAWLAADVAQPRPAHAIGGEENGIGWQYSEQGRAYYRQPANSSPSGPSGPPREMTVWGKPGVDLECPEGDPDYDCGDFPGVYCADGFEEALGPRGLPRFPFIRYIRDVPENGPPGKWRPAPGQGDYGGDGTGWHNNNCVEPGENDVVTMEEIYDVNYDVFQGLGKPDIDTRPANGKTVVNLETIVSTKYPTNVEAIPGATLDPNAEPPQIRIEDTIEKPGDDLHYVIEAKAGFNWTFTGGVPGTGEGRGHDFNGTLPKNAAAGYYVTTKFQNTGPQTITLDVGWTGTVKVDGLDPKDMNPVELDAASETIDVVESKAVLGD